MNKKWEKELIRISKELIKSFSLNESSLKTQKLKS